VEAETREDRADRDAGVVGGGEGGLRQEREMRRRRRWGVE